MRSTKNPLRPLHRKVGDVVLSAVLRTLLNDLHHVSVYNAQKFTARRGTCQTIGLTLGSF